MMWFCPSGHNAFETDEDRPECAACGAVMSTDDTAFNDVIEAIQEREIAEFEDNS